MWTCLSPHRSSCGGLTWGGAVDHLVAVTVSLGFLPGEQQAVGPRHFDPETPWR